VEEAIALPELVARGGVGGVLMGLANLVPGVSGGTMLLAAGVYPTFISAIADLTTLRFRTRSIVALGTIGGAAALVILLFAGVLKDLVIEQRWAMYSIFIGLTLGGVPVVWRLARPATPTLWASAAVGFVLMVLMAFGGERTISGGTHWPLLLLSGLAGASAMILPGVSGGYILLLLGQYEVILGAVDSLKIGLFGWDGGGVDGALVMGSMDVLVPVGVGVVIGVVGVGNLLKWLLQHHDKAILGLLLGLLVGAVVGLYPFQEPVRPAEGYVHRGVVLDAAGVASLDEKHWPLQRVPPTGGQIAGALALALGGFTTTLLIDRLGGRKTGTEGRN